MKIVALSMTQPWASLLSLGVKRIETRSWPTSYRGLVAIHASKGFPKDARETATKDQPFFRALAQAGIYDIDQLPLGAIVAIGKLEMCLRTEHLLRIGRVSDEEKPFGNYAPGRYGFVFEELRALPEPIPAKGALSLWTPEPDVLAKLVEFWGEEA